MPKILVVEDSNEIRTKLSQLLSGEGYDVLEGADGLEGLTLAQDNQDINVIISDYLMPNMNGLEMCEKIKKIESHQATPFVMLTTESSDMLRSRGRKAGVSSWIVKPFSPMGILNVIKGFIMGELKLDQKGMIERHNESFLGAKTDKISLEEKLLALEEENRQLKTTLQSSLFGMIKPNRKSGKKIS
ncbi:MAG: response regulator [Oligoflexales bacterium]|nr:response regulator [Oligoflexales bacterium]